MVARRSLLGSPRLAAPLPATLLPAALLLAGAVWSGCGYRFVGPGSLLPGGVRSVCAPLLVNRTAEPAAEALFTRALRAGLVERGLAATGTCDATLRGELLRVGYGGGVASGPTGVVSYRVGAALRLTLERGGEVLGRVEVAGDEDFLPGTDRDVLTAEANGETALQRLADTLAREGLERLAVQE